MRAPYIWTLHMRYRDKEWDNTTMPGYYPVSIYKDSTGEYTDEECDDDNVVEIPVPADLLWQWFVECVEFDREECCWTPDGGWDDPTHEDLINWVYKESTCDDTYMLYEWLCNHNYFWKRLD